MTFKCLKTALIKGTHGQTLDQLSLELFDYINWYNNIRAHSTLGYLSPVAYKNLAHKINVAFFISTPSIKVEYVE